MIADIVVVLIILVFAFLGKHRGLIKSLAGVLSFALSAALVYFFSGAIVGLAKKTPVYDGIVDYVINKSTQQGHIGSILAANTSEDAANFILKILVFVIIFVVARLIVKLTDRLFRLPVLRSVNALGGLALGLIWGFALIYIVFAIWGSTTLF